MENKTGAYLVAIVALVAVVGLVLMFTGKSTTSDDIEYVVDEEGNLVGFGPSVGNNYPGLDSFVREGRRIYVLPETTITADKPAEADEDDAAETESEDTGDEEVKDVDTGVHGGGCPPTEIC